MAELCKNWKKTKLVIWGKWRLYIFIIIENSTSKKQHQKHVKAGIVDSLFHFFMSQTG